MGRAAKSDGLRSRAARILVVGVICASARDRPSVTSRDVRARRRLVPDHHRARHRPPVRLQQAPIPAPFCGTAPRAAHLFYAGAACAHRDLRATSPTSFDSVEAPCMSVHSYLQRIRRYTRFDDMCFLIALAYLGRIAQAGGPSLCLTHHNVHRLLVTALVLASKSSDDVFHANSFMAQCGGGAPPAQRARTSPRMGVKGSPPTVTPAHILPQGSRSASSMRSRLSFASGSPSASSPTRRRCARW